MAVRQMRWSEDSEVVAVVRDVRLIAGMIVHRARFFIGAMTVRCSGGPLRSGVSVAFCGGFGASCCGGPSTSLRFARDDSFRGRFGTLGCQRGVGGRFEASCCGGPSASLRFARDDS